MRFRKEFVSEEEIVSIAHRAFRVAQGMNPKEKMRLNLILESYWDLDKKLNKLLRKVERRNKKSLD